LRLSVALRCTCLLMGSLQWRHGHDLGRARSLRIPAMGETSAHRNRTGCPPCRSWHADETRQRWTGAPASGWLPRRTYASLAIKNLPLGTKLPLELVVECWGSVVPLTGAAPYGGSRGSQAESAHRSADWAVRTRASRRNRSGCLNQAARRVRSPADVAMSLALQLADHFSLPRRVADLHTGLFHQCTRMSAPAGFGVPTWSWWGRAGSWKRPGRPPPLRQTTSRACRCSCLRMSCSHERMSPTTRAASSLGTLLPAPPWWLACPVHCSQPTDRPTESWVLWAIGIADASSRPSLLWGLLALHRQRWRNAAVGRSRLLAGRARLSTRRDQLERLEP